MTTEQVNNEAIEDGDIFDGDTGEYYFTLPEEAKMPAVLDICYEGFWYTFKIAGRRLVTAEELGVETIPLSQEEEADINTVVDTELEAHKPPANPHDKFGDL